MEDYNTYRMNNCAYCGKRFKDDCGDEFCSSSCSNQYDREHTRCDDCGDEFNEDDLENGVCENCWDERENEDDEN